MNNGVPRQQRGRSRVNWQPARTQEASVPRVDFQNSIEGLGNFAVEPLGGEACSILPAGGRRYSVAGRLEVLHRLPDCSHGLRVKQHAGRLIGGTKRAENVARPAAVEGVP